MSERSGGLDCGTDTIGILWGCDIYALALTGFVGCIRVCAGGIIETAIPFCGEAQRYDMACDGSRTPRAIIRSLRSRAVPCSKDTTIACFTGSVDGRVLAFGFFTWKRSIPVRVGVSVCCRHAVVPSRRVGRQALRSPFKSSLFYLFGRCRNTRV